VRTQTAQDDRIFSARGQTTGLRVQVRDHGGTLRDLAYGGIYNYNRVSKVTLSESFDKPTATGQILLAREIFKDALATEIATSRLNTIGGGSRLLELDAEVIISTQLIPLGLKPNAAKWIQIFDGSIDNTDSGPDPMRVSVSDMTGRLTRAEVLADVQHGFRAPSRRFLINYIVIAVTDNPANPAALYQAQNTGTTAASVGDPVWPGVGGTVVDGGVTWKNLGAVLTFTPAEVMIQQILDDALGAGVWTLYTPVSPSFVIRPYIQSQGPVLPALQNIADAFGWSLRWRWTDNPPPAGWAAPPGGVAGWYLTLYNPNRANVTSVYTFPASKYDPIPKLERDIAGIRNREILSYYNSAVLDNNNNPTFTTVQFDDAASQAQYGVLPFSIAEGASSMIDTAAEANAMGAAILSDLAQPPVDGVIKTDLTWWPQIHDLITVKADGLRFSADQDLAIVGIDTELTGTGRSTSTFAVRGKPSSGRGRWHNKRAAPAINGGPLRGASLQQAIAATATAGITGAVITYQIPSPRTMRYDVTELHISTSNGFTPSGATLWSIGKAGAFSVKGLTSGTTYYARLIHRDTRGVAALAAPQLSFVAGYTNFPHLNPNYTQNALGLALTATVAADNANFVVTLDLQNYDQGGIFNPATGIFQIVSGGTFLFTFGSVITGGAIGDLVQLAVEWWNGAYVGRAADHALRDVPANGRGGCIGSMAGAHLLEGRHQRRGSIQNVVLPEAGHGRQHANRRRRRLHAEGRPHERYPALDGLADDAKAGRRRRRRRAGATRTAEQDGKQDKLLHGVLLEVLEMKPYLIAILLATGCATAHPKMSMDEAGLPAAEPSSVRVGRELQLMAIGALPPVKLAPLVFGTVRLMDQIVKGASPTASGDVLCATAADLASWQTAASCGLATGTNYWTISTRKLQGAGGQLELTNTTDEARTMGWTSFPATATNVLRYQFGDAANGFQSANGRQTTIYSYWGLVIAGAQQTSTPPLNAVGASGDFSLEIKAAGGGGGALKVDAASDFTGGTITAASVNTTAGTLTAGTTNTTAGTLTTGTMKIGSSGAQITASYTGTTSTLPTATAQTCTNLATHITVTSAATGAPCSLGVPSGFAVALAPWCFVDGSGTVQIKFCNPTTGNLTPTAGTYTVRVWNP
jgi:hypothetical protein